MINLDPFLWRVAACWPTPLTKRLALQPVIPNLSDRLHSHGAEESQRRPLAVPTSRLPSWTGAGSYHCPAARQAPLSNSDHGSIIYYQQLKRLFYLIIAVPFALKVNPAPRPKPNSISWWNTWSLRGNEGVITIPISKIRKSGFSIFKNTNPFELVINRAKIEDRTICCNLGQRPLQPQAQSPPCLSARSAGSVRMWQDLKLTLPWCKNQLTCWFTMPLDGW